MNLGKDVLFDLLLGEASMSTPNSLSTPHFLCTAPAAYRDLVEVRHHPEENST